MIPQADIFKEFDFPEAIPEVDWEIAFDLIQFISGKIHVWKDPFYLIKMKCPPNFPPKSLTVVETRGRYVSQPFPLSKIDSVSFERPTMSNLLVDKDGRLLQLLFKTESTQELKPWYEYIEVIEYHTPVWIFLGRKPL